MKNELIWNKYAKEDLNNIVQHIAVESISRAFNLKFNIEYLALNLIEFPRIGKLYHINEAFEIRILNFKKYDIYYMIKNTTITILFIIHTSRNFKNDN